jgi:hypothetical protein
MEGTGRVSITDHIIERLNSQRLDVHRIREGEYRSRCPVHGGKSNNSLSITDTGERALLHCFHGCSIETLTAAIGCKPSDLFDTSRMNSADRARIEHQRQVKDGFKVWRNAEETCCGEELRSRDMARLAINADVDAGRLSAEEALEKLAPLYSGYSELEYRFEILRTGTDSEALELFNG